MFGRTRIHARNRRRDDTPSVWRHVFVGVGICSFATLIAVGVWHFTRLPAFTLATIDVEGGDTIPNERVRAEIASVLGGSYFKIIPYTFSLLYPKEQIATAVTAIPRVKDVAIERDMESLLVTFTEYAPYALWCRPEHEACYFLDETGYAFAPGPRLEGGALIRHMFEDDGELGKRQVFEPEAFSAVHAFLFELSDVLGLRVTDVLYTKDGDVKLSVNGGGTLFIRGDASYDATFENLESVLASDEFKHLKPGEFQYIDLRFGNKVFVNEEEPVIATTTASTTEDSEEGE